MLMQLRYPSWLLAILLTKIRLLTNHGDVCCCLAADVEPLWLYFFVNRPDVLRCTSNLRRWCL